MTVDFVACPVTLASFLSSSSGFSEAVTQAVPSAVGVFIEHAGQIEPECKTSIGNNKQPP